VSFKGKGLRDASRSLVSGENTALEVLELHG